MSEDINTVVGTSSLETSTSKMLLSDKGSTFRTGQPYYYDVFGKFQFKEKDEKTGAEKISEISVTNYITYFVYDQDFDNGNFPSFKLTINAPVQIVKAILNSYNNGSFFLSLNRVLKSVNGEKVKTPPEEIFYNKEFVTMSPNNSPFDEDGTGRPLSSIDELKGQYRKISFNLIERECLNSRKTIDNYVFKQATIADVLRYLVGEHIKNRKLIIGQPDNEEEYEQIFIPPLNLFDSLKYLQFHYGIYKNGMIFFNSLKEFILCGKNKKILTTKDENGIEEIVVKILNKNILKPEPGGFASSVVHKETKKIEIVTNDQPKFKMNDSIIKEKYGSSISIGRTGEEIVNTKGNGGIETDDDKATYMWAKCGNKFFDEDITLEINEKTEQIVCVFENSYIDYFLPNMKVTVIFSSPANRDYKGEFRISAVKHMMARMENSKAIKEESVAANTMQVVSRVELVRV